ncbi:hypothetical protein TNCT6_43830 [Streptomyces sp. 6-11-2]|nr:hypothetical protein TNCT6_43830 [Streptomyces sp. 6-11-2]
MKAQVSGYVRGRAEALSRRLRGRGGRRKGLTPGPVRNPARTCAQAPEKGFHGRAGPGFSPPLPQSHRRPDGRSDPHGTVKKSLVRQSIGIVASAYGVDPAPVPHG